MRDALFYSLVGACVLASGAMAYDLFSSEPERAVVTSNAPAAPEPMANAKPAVQEPEWKCDVTLANYKALTVGMSYSRARAIFGCEGKETLRIDGGVDDTYVSYQWDLPGGGFTSIDFKNNGLTDKLWFGN